MTLGDVLRKERRRRGMTAAECATALALAESEYRRIEAGGTAAERWAPRLAALAVALETPMSRLLAPSGRSADCRPGQAGELIGQHRRRRGAPAEEIARHVGLSDDEYARVESGESPIEEVGPLLLGFAELVEQPVFNLVYPCGLPFQDLEDYP